MCGGFRLILRFALIVSIARPLPCTPDESRSRRDSVSPVSLFQSGRETGRDAAYAAKALREVWEPLHEAKIGVVVQRGPDWKWFDQDSGGGTTGITVPGATAEDWVAVRWAHEAESKHMYRAGAEGAYDLTVQPEPKKHEGVFFASADTGDSHAAVQNCVNQLRDSAIIGSTCKLRGGIYRFSQPVLISGFVDEIPKTITAADPSDPPLFHGTVDITHLAWYPVILKSCPSGCYAADYRGVAPWQLFIGEEMFLNARWPNAKWSDKSLFEATKGWAQSSKQSTFAGPSSCARAPDSNGGCPEGHELATEGVASGVCQNVVKMECLSGKEKGQIATLEPAECFMDDATPANDYGSKPLDQEDFNATGASVILNNGHWMSYTGKVKSHGPRSNSFTYESRPGWNVMKFIHDHTAYYLENSIELLDTPGEWFYDGERMKIYIMTPEGETPATWMRKAGPITARTQMYAFEITEARNLTISNLEFFATTIFAAGNRTGNRPKDYVYTPIMGNIWDGLSFKYPSTGKRMLGEVDYIPSTTLRMHYTYQGPVWNTIKNCKFFYVDGPTIDFSQEQGITIENNHFEWIDWTAVTVVSEALKRWKPGCFPTVTERGCFGQSASALWVPAGSERAGNIIRRNTLVHHGASSGIGFFGRGANMLVELNRIADKKDLQLDGGQVSIPAGAASGVILRRNWAYDGFPARPHAEKWGLRFDRGQSECSPKWGRLGGMYNNVVFNTNGLNVKGNEHSIVQNSVFWSRGSGGALDDPDASAADKVDVNLYGSRGGIGTCECGDSSCKRSSECCNGTWASNENALTEVTANLMENCRGKRGGILWTVSTGGTDSEFVDEQGVLNAKFNSAGEDPLKQMRDPRNFDFRPSPKTVAASECIGAYADVPQDGEAEYWIPGQQDGLPTFPVPPDGSMTAKRNGALAFNQALNAIAHRLYISDVASGDGGFQIELRAPNNLVGLPSTHNTVGKQYYWRVDPVFSVGKGHKQKRGKVWQYQVVEDDQAEPPLVPRCITFRGSTGQYNGNDWTEFNLNVPVNAGLPKRYVLNASTQICVHATGNFKSNYQFRIQGRSQKLLGGFFGFGTDRINSIDEVKGCFADDGVIFEPSSILPGATWLPRKGSWETFGTISEWMAKENIATAPATFKLRIKGSTGIGHLKSWSMMLCFDALTDEELPSRGTGACRDHAYS